MAEEITNPVTKELATEYVRKVNDPDDAGFTHPHMVTGEDPTNKNIMVSLPGREKLIRSQVFTPHAIQQYAEQNIGDLTQEKKYLGGYMMDPEVGRPADDRDVALDVSVGVPFSGRNAEKLPYVEAMRLAALHNQQSVYDPRPRAASMFPANPYYKKDVPDYAKDKDEWASRFILDALS
jgi:hypothetical protein